MSLIAAVKLRSAKGLPLKVLLRRSLWNATCAEFRQENRPSSSSNSALSTVTHFSNAQRVGSLIGMRCSIELSGINQRCNSYQLHEGWDFDSLENLVVAIAVILADLRQPTHVTVDAGTFTHKKQATMTGADRIKQRDEHLVALTTVDHRLHILVLGIRRHLLLHWLDKENTIAPFYGPAKF